MGDDSTRNSTSSSALSVLAEDDSFVLDCGGDEEAEELTLSRSSLSSAEEDFSEASIASSALSDASFVVDHSSDSDDDSSDALTDNLSDDDRPSPIRSRSLRARRQRQDERDAELERQRLEREKNRRKVVVVDDEFCTDEEDSSADEDECTDSEQDRSVRSHPAAAEASFQSRGSTESAVGRLPTAERSPAQRSPAEPSDAIVALSPETGVTEVEPSVDLPSPRSNRKQEESRDGRHSAGGDAATVDEQSGECSLCLERVPSVDVERHVRTCGLRKDFCNKCEGWIQLQFMREHMETNCKSRGGDSAPASEGKSSETEHGPAPWRQRRKHPGRWYLGKRFWITDALYETLAPHQRDGVGFLWKLYQSKSGGVLADDMGLGKTMQAVSFVRGLANAREEKYGYAVLVIVEKSLLSQWRDEFERHGNIDVVMVADGTKKRRQAQVEEVREMGGVLLTTYNMVSLNIEWFKPTTLTLTAPGDTWDSVILDEGHKIKNHNTKLARELRTIVSRSRLILTGTVIQNNLTELWAIFDYACNRKLLGTIRTFKSAFETPIIQGSKKDAKPEVLREKHRMQALLIARLAPHLLRRDRKMLIEAQTADDLLRPKDSKLSDYVVWLELTDAQVELMKALLASDAVRQAVNTKNPLTLIQGLKTICEHPMLLRSKHRLLEQLPKDALERWGIFMTEHTMSHDVIAGEGVAETSEQGYLDLSQTSEWQSGKVPDAGESSHIETCLADELLLMVFSYLCRRQDKAAAARVCRRWHYVLRVEIVDPESARFLINTSAKMCFLSQLLPRLFAEGHRVLIFAQQRRMLEMVGAFLRASKLNFLHMDGETSAKARAEAVRQFNSNSNDEAIFAFLTTTGCGSVGLNLTGADRVVILDPSWNPSADLQAVHRAFRIGQKRDVVCYRLITNGTIEETVYKRQVFKGSIDKGAMNNWKEQGFFTDHDLHGEIFTIGNTHRSMTAALLRSRAEELTSNGEDSETVGKLESLDQQISFLESLSGQSCFTGLSDHSLLFTSKRSDVEPMRSNVSAPHSPIRASLLSDDNNAGRPEVTATPTTQSSDEDCYEGPGQNQRTPSAGFRSFVQGPPNTPIESATPQNLQTPRHPYHARRRLHSNSAGNYPGSPQIQEISSLTRTPERKAALPTTGAVSRTMRARLLREHSDSENSSDGESDDEAMHGDHRHELLRGVKIDGIAGRGHFSVVYHGRYRGQKVALKLPHTQDAEFEHEVNMLAQLRHENVLEYFGLYKNRFGTYIVTEMMTGSVKDYLEESQSGDLRVIDLLRMILCAVRGMQFLSERSPPVLHRDLAARNLLISEIPSEREKSFIVKVADFGMARSLYSSNIYVANNKTVAANWAAPEVLTNALFSVASDVYSMGVTAWEILTLGSIPYHDLNGALDSRAAMTAIKAGQVLPPPEPEFLVPTAVYDRVLRPCWNMDRALRPTFEALRDAVEREIRVLMEPDSDFEDETESECAQTGYYVNIDGSPQRTEAPTCTEDSPGELVGNSRLRSIPHHLFAMSAREAREAHRNSMEVIASPVSSVCSSPVPAQRVAVPARDFTKERSGSPRGKTRVPLVDVNADFQTQETYKNQLSQGQSAESSGDLENALHFALNALELCDSDHTLHDKIVQLGHDLGLVD